MSSSHREVETPLDVLGGTAPAPVEGERISEHALLAHHLARVTADLHRLDPLVRADAPDAVHKMRVATRRLRSTLKAFRKSFDRDVTEPVRSELGWLGAVLGRTRDLEVLGQHLRDLLLAEPAELVRGGIDDWVDARLRAERDVAHDAALQGMSSKRYRDLLDTLDSWTVSPPWREERDRPAHQRLPRAVDRAAAALDHGATAVGQVPEGSRAGRLHEVRKAAKRVRYAAETLAPVAGPAYAQRARAAERIQELLGEHHDAIVAGEHVLQLADAATAQGQDAFTLGILHARLESQAAQQEAEFVHTWQELRKAL